MWKHGVKRIGFNWTSSSVWWFHLLDLVTLFSIISMIINSIRCIVRMVTAVKDLAVLFTAEISFREHIVIVSKKDYRNLGLILRRVQGLWVLLPYYTYKAHVTPQMVNGSLAPHQMRYSLMQERIKNICIWGNTAFTSSTLFYPNLVIKIW